MENVIFDAKIRKTQWKKKLKQAKTNKTKVCIPQKSGSNSRHVFTVHNCFQLSYVLYKSPKITEFEV